MNSAEQVAQCFGQKGFTPQSRLTRGEMTQVLNALMQGQPFDGEIAGEIWEQAAGSNPKTSVHEIALTVAQAQDIVRERLLDSIEEVKALEEERMSAREDHNQQRLAEVEAEIEKMHDDKLELEEDLRYLTEPFGINPLAFVARMSMSRRSGAAGTSLGGPADPQAGWEWELKVLLVLTLGLCACEVVVIFQKYDFVNLLVVGCLCLIFALNQFDPAYIKFTLALLAASELLDIIWLFMNSAQYWSPAEDGVYSAGMGAYLKVIIVLTYIGVFAKIPVGVCLWHYRAVDPQRAYVLDLGMATLTLTQNKNNPISHQLHHQGIFTSE